ncbi:hypothetical protein E2320_002272 [Naja naja]|nr:hypothetical protein E2320_002272 [Naja naja]
MILWRAATGPMADHNEPAEWQYQMAMCNQTFEDLPDQMEQLVIGCEDRGPQDGHFTQAEDGFKTKLKLYQPYCSPTSAAIASSAHKHPNTF